MDKENLYQSLLIFLKESKPRKVPSQFVYSNPIAGLFIILGAIFSTMLICMAVVFGVLQQTQGCFGTTASPYISFLTAVMSIIPLFLLIYGIINRKKCVKYLANGDLAKGLVLSVKPLGARINSRTFFDVKVRYSTAENENLVATDVVDNWAMEYFLNARDNKTMVDVLFLPGTPKKVLLIYKIVTIKQFD
jgi:hypothetical protein